MSETEDPQKIDSEEKKDSSASESEKELSSDDTTQKNDSKENLVNLSSVEILDFKKTPLRNKELHRFEQILNAPIHNIPMLFVEKHEDVLPLLSLYANKHLDGFLSISPSSFGIDAEPHEVEKKLNLAGTIIEYGELPNIIPVYSDIVDYMECNLWPTFSKNFLQTEKPTVIVAKKSEQEVLQEEIKENLKSSGCLENTEAPYIPMGLGRSSVLKIAPMTDDEKKVYLSYYVSRIFCDNGLNCSARNQTFLVQEAIRRTSGECALSDAFKFVDHLVVLTKQAGENLVSRDMVKQALLEKLPLHNRTKALVNMDKRLKKQIFGQDEAIDKAYETILATLDDEKREKPTVLAFFGPSGVGKTALAEEISLAMTGKKVVKINMAEYSDSFKASILTGSSKGYVDSDEDGLLAKTIKENPNAVILLDEFEKAHPKVQQLFLGVFDKGSLFDNHAGHVDMSKSTIILTSNAGVRSEQTLGFGASNEPNYIADENIIKESFPPELLGRLDAKILFSPLNESALEKIIDKYMTQINPRFEKLGIRVSLSRKAKEELLAEGKNPMYGARPILSLIRQKVKLPIEVAVLKKKIKKGNRVVFNSVQKKQMTILPKQIKNQNNNR